MKVRVQSFETLTKLFRSTIRKVFSNTISNSHVYLYGYYDKLIIDCVFQKPLLIRQPDIPDILNGCTKFMPI